MNITLIKNKNYNTSEFNIKCMFLMYILYNEMKMRIRSNELVANNKIRFNGGK